jgi:hypothetical protein
MAQATRQDPAGRGKVEPRPGDTTALKNQALEVERDERAAESTRQAAATAAAEAEAALDVIDPFRQLDEPLPEPERDEVEDENPEVVVLMKYDCPQFVYGREWDKVTGDLGGIVELNLVQGRRYKLPKAMAKHLDDRGFLYHLVTPRATTTREPGGCHFHGTLPGVDVI